MALLIKLPGTLTNTAGMPRLVTTLDGFPDLGLSDLFLFSDGSGLAAENSVAGRSSGTIEAPVAINNAYAWLSGGGLSLSGTQLVTAPIHDASEPWSIVSAGAFTGSVGGTASERIGGVMGHKQSFLAAPFRGAMMYARGSTDWNSGTGPISYQSRAMNSGATGTAQYLLPSGLSERLKRRLRVMTYDGSSAVTSTVYDHTGAVVATNTIATSDAEMFTASGETVTDLNPCLGIPSATYSGGVQQIEAFAVYSRVIDSTEVSTILKACAALGDARGRPWT